MELDEKEIRQNKAKECAEKINKVLEEYGFQIEPTIAVTKKGIFPSIELVDATPQTGVGTEVAKPTDAE